MGREERARAGWAGVLISAALLSACGGGGSDSPSTPPPVQGVAIPDNLAISAAAATDVAAGTAFTSNAASTAGLSFAWTFGDGGTSTEPSPRHDFAKVGDYAVTLKVSNAAGVSKDVKWTVSVFNRAHVQGLNCSGTDGGGWCWQAPRPTGTTPNAFFFLDASNGWSVGDNGEILRSRDGGSTWTKQPSGLTTRLTAIRFADANTGWAAGDAGALLRTTDGGAHWMLQPAAQPPMAGASLQVQGASMLVASSGGRILATGDGGASWTQAALPQDPVLGSDGSLWWFEGAALRKSTDLGKTSTASTALDSSGYGSSFQVFGNTVIVAGSTSGYVSGIWTSTNWIRRTEDGGATWQTITPQGLPGTGQAVTQFVDAAVGAAAVGNALYRSTDGGRTWVVTPPPASLQPGSYLSYSSPAPGVWARQYYSTSWVSMTEMSLDAGATWRPGAANGQRPVRIDAQTWLATDWDGVTRISTDAMQSWKRVAGPAADAAAKTLQAFWFFDAKRGLALSAAGDLLETGNGGLDWTVKLAGLTSSYYGGRPRFQFLDAKKGWLQAADGRIYLTDDAGASWVTPLQPGSLAIVAFHFADAANGFALAYDAQGARQVLLSSTDGGKSWTQQSVLNGTYIDLKFSSALKGVLAGQGGAVAVTADGGKTISGRFSGTGAALQQLTLSDADTFWVVGDGGTLMSSKDGGTTWTQQASVSLPTIGLRAVRFLTAQQGWAVGDNGTVLATTDGGVSWKKQFAGTQNALTQVLFVDARTGWVAGSNGTLLATGTGGQ